MRWFEYGDEHLSHREILIAIPSIVIGVGVLSFPRELATDTTGPDGWLVILVSGGCMTFFAWLMARLTARFPHQTFFEYTAKIISKPLAVVITAIFILQMIGITAMEVRQISEIAKQYLFDTTPIEALSLAFLLIVTYAVSGSRAGIFRLNLMFLPIIVLISILVVVLNVGWFKMDHILPVFKTDMSGYMKGLGTGIVAYMGFSIILFYTFLVEKPERVPKSAVIGMLIPVVLYMWFFLASIITFGNTVTANLIFPIVELAKEVDIPGGFLDRFESVFFVIWVMAIFNSAVMAMDIAVLLLGHLFKHQPKILFVCILAPVIYVIAMYPEDLLTVLSLSNYFGYGAVVFTVLITIILLVIAKLRRVGNVD